MADLTVLTENDPYRIDTPDGHRIGAWFADQLRARRGDRLTHLRGFHYALVAAGDVRKPDSGWRDPKTGAPSKRGANGAVYANTEEDWTWLQSEAAKAARWLGYVDFEQIIDNRNDPPFILRAEDCEPETTLDHGLRFALPRNGLAPQPVLSGFVGRQQFALVFHGEKSSLKTAMLPLAERFGADLYLPNGEISDTLLFQMASDAVEDGRTLVVFTVTDCDPSGRQMPISIGRKLQALRDLRFAELEFVVVPVALTPEQVKELGLPSTPLKEGEKRADRWVAAFGVEQTEIDAMFSTDERVETLTGWIEEAVAPYFDASLAERVETAKTKWLADAKAQVAARIDAKALTSIENMAGRLGKIADALDERLEKMADTVGELPEAKVPEPDLTFAQFMAQGEGAIADTEWDWTCVTLALKAHKSYGNGHGDGE